MPPLQFLSFIAQIRSYKDAEKVSRIEQGKILQQQLEETEQQLLQMQNQQVEWGSLVINPKQQPAIDVFMQNKVTICEFISDIRHQLIKGVERLVNWLRFINITIGPFIPILLFALL
jgi:hypothetical protein